MSTTHPLGTAPGSLPWLEHPWQLLRRPLAFLTSLREHGDMVKIRLGPEWVYLVQHPELVHQVLVASSVFDKGGPFYDKARLVFGNGLGTCPHADHRGQRRRMQPAFSHDRLPEQTAVMRAEVGATADTWRHGQVVDVFKEMSALSLAISVHTMFVLDSVAEPAAAVQRSMPVVSQGLYQRVLAPLGLLERLPLPGNRRFDDALRRMRAAVDRVIADYRRSGVVHGDVLATLLAVRDEATGEGMSDLELRDQALTLVVGGFETTAAALTWVFHLLGQHPEVERRLHDEVDEVLAGGPAEYDDVPKLAYAQRIVEETLRLYPPAWMLTRRTTAEVELGGHRLPPGTSILLCPYALHRDPALFADAERFDPDRWRPDRAQAVPRGAMVPFGGGPRKCIGVGFAMAEAIIVVATLAARFRLRPIPGTKVDVIPRMALVPGSLPMRVEARHPARTT